MQNGFTKKVEGIWKKMYDSLDNIHSDKKIKPTDFLWRIQKWAYFGKLWNPKPMNYCPYYWMGVFTTIMTFLIPIIPIVHFFYYFWISTKYISIKLWKGFSFITLNIAAFLTFIFTPVGKMFSKLGDILDKWLDGMTTPIKEQRRERQKNDFAKRPMDDFILYYLLTSSRNFVDTNVDSEKDFVSVSNKVSTKFKSCKSFDYNWGVEVEDVMSHLLYKNLNTMKFSSKERNEKAHSRNKQRVQDWVEGNPNWFKKFSKHLDKNHSDYKWRCEWMSVKGEIDDKSVTDYKKFKKFNKEISDLEKLKRRNRIVAKVINFTKIFMKVLICAIVLGLASWGVYGLTLVSKAIWVEIGFWSGISVGGVAILVGLGYLLRYLFAEKEIGKYIIKGFGKFFKVLSFIKVIFLPIILLFKIIGKRFGMLLDWKKENCPHIIYEDFDE